MPDTQLTTRHRNLSRQWLVGSLALVVLAFLLWGFWPSPPGAPARGGAGGGGGAGAVRVANVTQGDFPVELKSLGTVTAYNTVNVRGRVEGELVKLLFRDGQQVKAGDLLAVIDPRSYEIALQQAQGALQESQAQLRNAELDLARYRGLYAEDSIAKQTLDTQEALVNQYRGGIKSLQADVATARLNLEFTQIRAPITGRLGIRQADVGNLVSSGDELPLVVITQTLPIAVMFTLPEAELPAVVQQLRSGATLAVEAWDRSEKLKLAEGELESVDNLIDTATGTVKLKARFANAEEMLFPNQFVNLRPVATTLIMLAIFLSGLIAYRLLPVSALPEVDYPTIRVMTLYPGASPDVMTSAVTAPLERQFGQMAGLKQMSSTSSGGASVITLRFNLEVKLDVAEQEVQAAINGASNLLPDDLPAPPVYNKVNPADTPILTLAIRSNTLPLPQVFDLVDTRLAQKLAQTSGVGLVSLAGGQRPAVRLRVNPEALASYGLNLSDVRTLITASNVNQPKGNFDGPTRVSQLDANDQLKSVDEYRELILGYKDGATLRLKDVAEIIDGAENQRLAAWANRNEAVLVNVQRQPGANVIDVVDSIQTLLPNLTQGLPASVEVSVLTDRTETIRAAVKGVQHELLLAIALVVLVTFLFLRKVSANIIPSIVVPLSLIGTFGVMYLAGFTINNLTLMALTIATGFVVDDAIVMLENIARHLEEGETPLNAALKGARQIGFTLVSLTISLIAVLIPLLFMADVVGRLFREFAITLAVAILISLVVSLTLTPMMCARLLKA